MSTESLAADHPAKELATAALLLAVGIIIQGVEALYLPSLMIPGAKLGLANSITMLVVILFGWREVMTHVALRSTVVSLITGTFLSTTYLYSLTGALLSALVMLFIYRHLYGPLSYVGISIFGALVHNLTQLTLSIFILGHIGIVSLLPWLLGFALLTGAGNGTLVNIVGPRLDALGLSGRFGRSGQTAGLSGEN